MHVVAKHNAFQRINERLTDIVDVQRSLASIEVEYNDRDLLLDQEVIWLQLISCRFCHPVAPEIPRVRTGIDASRRTPNDELHDSSSS